MTKLDAVAKWVDRWWPTCITGIGAVLAVGGPFWGNFQADDGSRVLAFIIGALGALTALTLPIYDRRRVNSKIRDLESDVLKAAVEGRSEFLLVLDHGLTPLLEQLGRVSLLRPASARREAAASLKVQALNTLKEVTGPAAGKRATYFRLMNEESRPKLVADKSTGLETRPSFDSTTVEGRRALRVVETRKPDYCPSVSAAPEGEIDKKSVHKYETFVSAAAFDGVKVDGLLTVDAPKRGDLSPVDQVVVRLVATIVAISEAIKGNN